MKHDTIKLKKRPARLAQLLQLSLAFCFSLPFHYDLGEDFLFEIFVMITTSVL